LEDVEAPERPKRRRRSWSGDEKQRMVSEVLSAGASVADIARQHGVNANLLFNWVRNTRRLSLGVASNQASAALCDFIQLGVVARAPDGGPAELTKPPFANATTSVEAKARPGLIEIELTNGARLRVDAFVNERALHRVLSVLKATS
jgi:transposase